MLEQVKLSGVKQELKSIAPALLNIEERNTVKVPVGYFDLFSSGLIKKIRANEIAAELNVVAPTLSTLEKEK